MRAGSQILIISSRLKISCSPSGAQPQQQQIVQNSGGQITLCHQVLIAGIAVTLGKLVLCVFHDRRAVDVGGTSQPNAWYSRLYFGVLERYSLPRMTW